MDGFKEFCNVIKDTIAETLPGRNIESVKINEVTKNNGVVLTGLTIMENGSNIAPNIYLDGYYEMYQSGTDMTQIKNMIRDEYLRAVPNTHEFDKIMYTDKNYIYDNVYLRAVNYERNKGNLGVFDRKLDMALEYRVLAKLDGSNIASFKLDKNILTTIDLDMGIVRSRAMENTKLLFPGEIVSMAEKLGMLGMVGEQDIPGMPQMYICSNVRGVNGATAMFYEELIYDFAAEHNDCSFYILPSSVHEVIFIPDSECYDSKELQDMVKQINKEVVSNDEILSDSVYKYDGKTKEIVIAEKGSEEKTKEQEYDLFRD